MEAKFFRYTVIVKDEIDIAKYIPVYQLYRGVLYLTSITNKNYQKNTCNKTMSNCKTQITNSFDDSCLTLKLNVCTRKVK